MTNHWPGRYQCVCGKTFAIGSEAEYHHRRNFPAYCQAPKPKPEEPAKILRPNKWSKPYDEQNDADRNRPKPGDDISD